MEATFIAVGAGVCIGLFFGVAIGIVFTSPRIRAWLVRPVDLDERLDRVDMNTPLDAAEQSRFLHVFVKTMRDPDYNDWDCWEGGLKWYCWLVARYIKDWLRERSYRGRRTRRWRVVNPTRSWSQLLDEAAEKLHEKTGVD